MTTYLTADHHFGHALIIEYCDRPFGSVEEMDAAMIERWNASVYPDDLVVHLGNFALASREHTAALLDVLNGYKVLGNHDRSATAMRACGFDEAYKGEYVLDGVRCVHDPGEADARAGETKLCGHVHAIWDELLREDGARLVNVGVDVRGFFPVVLGGLLPAAI